ncbi:uncharacterized protein LOC111278090 [Durio zibethinus]|uniref:Uncharacterized protein LOC111278090 n=1 Tax=Durio zibethinus TaxID=66656 RepID=A0A6P5WXC3_DURZI|nr:uncharacterized protein LOC111278090 [Durio zibethinus]XP_022720277.1 uncharacterized protein LOC111278090 [Durio zibethinus]XP_022720279.1 uncharacterized protein LOC111278090 [Durio zibethinus]XP_022720280.1 uncharacterized protein LOC111278090 [Durio zibethinus]XP_022720281.1 uncharacterized protein LOC111278090 [Durio zibethinus]XP_022720282.1 uncharacterized protein LOC111278090 [Durio zibethinus]XP_022720283.1 uncharacterized protein LOC111278090 [Durio zibethinus]XP_022720284.1 unc
MNFLLAREDAEKHAGIRSCFYCNKVFNNYRALGGHLRIHQEDKTLRTLNYPGRSCNSMDITRNPHAPLPNSPQNSLVGGNNLTPFTRVSPALDFSWMFCSNETNQASRSKFTGNNPGLAQTQIIMYPDFSYGCGNGATYHHNILASKAFAPVGVNAAMSSAAFPSSGSLVAAGFPIDSSLYLGSNGVCQFNTDEFQISKDGLPPSSGDALQSILGPPRCSSLDKVRQYDRRSLLICEEGKRSFLVDESGNADIMNASKKPKIAPNAHVEPEDPQKKELSLFMDVADSVSASETCFGAEEEGPIDVDLSLHL